MSELLTYLRNLLPPELLTALVSPTQPRPWDSSQTAVANAEVATAADVPATAAGATVATPAARASTPA
eukprot:SAG11_NODE_26481_length_344_cov_3.542857_1_plen_67_part_10